MAYLFLKRDNFLGIRKDTNTRCEAEAPFVSRANDVAAGKQPGRVISRCFLFADGAGDGGMVLQAGTKIELKGETGPRCETIAVKGPTNQTCVGRRRPSLAAPHTAVVADAAVVAAACSIRLGPGRMRVPGRCRGA